MKITVKNKEYEIGKITRKRYTVYSNLLKELETKTHYADEDLERVLEVIVDLYDKQFTVEDLDEEFDVSDIIVNFIMIQAEVGNKIENKISKVQKLFTQSKK